MASKTKVVVRILTSALFVGAGVTHFLQPDGYEKIVPPQLPSPRAIVYISGVFEILGAIGLLVPRTRRAAGLGLAALLVAVYPANVYQALSGLKLGGVFDQPWYNIVRLPLQFPMLWQVLWVSKADKPSTKE